MDIYNMYIQNLYVYMCACVYVRLGKFKGNMKGFLKEHKEQLKTSSDDICIKRQWCGHQCVQNGRRILKIMQKILHFIYSELEMK